MVMNVARLTTNARETQNAGFESYVFEMNVKSPASVASSAPFLIACTPRKEALSTASWLPKRRLNFSSMTQLLTGVHLQRTVSGTIR